MLNTFLSRVWHPFPLVLALLVTLFYFSLPSIIQSITSNPVYAKYAVRDAPIILETLQKNLIYPFGKYLSKAQRVWLIFPYWWLIFICLITLILYTKTFWKYIGITIIIILSFLYLLPNSLLIFENEEPSIAHGTVSKGYLENGKRIDFQGDNFTTYSFLGYLAGRTYTHGKVKKMLLDTYKQCAKVLPDITFVLGETSWRKGGSFLPHRTHRNGLSIDFMTPLLKNGIHYRTHHLLNLWGYRLEFDQKGKLGELEIDYETMARHLYELNIAAKKNGIKIKKVIFDPILRPYLLATPYGKKIKNLPFTRNRVVIRHDDHYHVDFKIE